LDVGTGRDRGTGDRTILGSFFYGYIATQVLGGYIATRFGGKHVFGFGILGTSVLTILTPFAARAGVSSLIVVRILEGFGEGVTFPAFHAILSRWVPSHEKTKMSTFAYAGAYIGTVVSQPVSSYLCGLDPTAEYPDGTRWDLVFYVCGGFGCFWWVLWILFFSNGCEPNFRTLSPLQPPTLSRHFLFHLHWVQHACMHVSMLCFVRGYAEQTLGSVTLLALPRRIHSVSRVT
jgi:MFS family permease